MQYLFNIQQKHAIFSLKKKKKHAIFIQYSNSQLFHNYYFFHFVLTRSNICKCHTTHEYLVLWQCPNQTNQTRELFSQKGHRKIETFVDYHQNLTEKLKEK